MNRRNFLHTLTLLLLVLLTATSPANGAPWKFGVMGDTQWTTADPSGKNPDSVPLSIIGQLNREFIRERVKFVIAVGDLSDNGQDSAETIRANAAKPLADAGIGFFAFRGNHEVKNGHDFGMEIFRQNYPQTRNGVFTTSGGQRFRVGSNFSSPISVSRDLDGLSYSFDYGDRSGMARFIIIDPWPLPGKLVPNPSGYPNGYSIHEQQRWIDSRLEQPRKGTRHLFVFSHQPLIAEGHQDTMFGGYADANPDWQNAFYASMQRNGARCFISGHDHIHQRSVVTSPDGQSRIQEIIAASCSSKFYTPKPVDDPKWFGQKRREVPLSQERQRVGFSIWTIDGPFVRVDYYSDDHGGWQSDSAFPNGAGRPDTGMSPAFRFVKRESWGYSLNGRQFLVPQGGSYTVVTDRHRGTKAGILDGINRSHAREEGPDAPEGSGRPLAKLVQTGWIGRKEANLFSDILWLDGLADPGNTRTDPYVLSMTFDPGKRAKKELLGGNFGLASIDEQGRAGNAAAATGATDLKFVAGPWKQGYPAGTWGVDLRHHTVWAVLEGNGKFAAAVFDH